MIIGRSRVLEICLISLYANRAGKFAGVVEPKGKFISAKFKKIHINSHRAILLIVPNTLDGSQQQTSCPIPQSCHSFYYEHLIPTLNDITKRSYREKYSNKAHLEITEKILV